MLLPHLNLISRRPSRRTPSVFFDYFMFAAAFKKQYILFLISSPARLSCYLYSLGRIAHVRDSDGGYPQVLGS